MRSLLLHLTCADLAPGCPAQLRGATAEELVLAYVAHRCEGHARGPVDLDDLLAHVAAVPLPRAA